MSDEILGQLSSQANYKVTHQLQKTTPQSQHNNVYSALLHMAESFSTSKEASITLRVNASHY